MFAAPGSSDNVERIKGKLVHLANIPMTALGASPGV
jgi:hypothetical protein